MRADEGAGGPEKGGAVLGDSMGKTGKKIHTTTGIFIRDGKSDDLLLFHLPDLAGYLMNILLEPCLALFRIISRTLIKHLEEPDRVHGAERF